MNGERKGLILLGNREAPFDHHERVEPPGIALDIVLVIMGNLYRKATDGQSRVL